jgi:hypothetical protein
MSRWYYVKGDQQSGPVSSDELKLLADTGLLQPTDPVWKEGEGESNRRPAGTLKNLFPDTPAVLTLPGPSHVKPPQAKPSPARPLQAEPPRPALSEVPPQDEPAPEPPTGPSFSRVFGFLVAMVAIFLGGGASYLYWTNTHRPLVLPAALLGLLLSNLVLLADWFADRTRFSLSVLGVTLNTVAALTAFVSDGGVPKTRTDVQQALAHLRRSGPPEPPQATATTEESSQALPKPRNPQEETSEPKAGGSTRTLRKPASAGSSPTLAARSKTMTKAELIAKIEALGNPSSRSDLFAAVGKPQEERTEQGQLAGLFWTWQCNDGKVEVVLLNPDFGNGEYSDKSLAYVNKINAN